MNTVLNEFKRNDTAAAATLAEDSLVKMLVEGAIEKMHQAVKAHQDSELVLKGFLIGRTTGIIDALRNGLDLETGGQQAHDLDVIYNHIDLCLQAATDPEAHGYLLEALDIMLGMASAWSDMPPLMNVVTAQAQHAAI